MLKIKFILYIASLSSAFYSDHRHLQNGFSINTVLNEYKRNTILYAHFKMLRGKCNNQKYVHFTPLNCLNKMNLAHDFYMDFQQVFKYTAVYQPMWVFKYTAVSQLMWTATSFYTVLLRQESMVILKNKKSMNNVNSS